MGGSKKSTTTTTNMYDQSTNFNNEGSIGNVLMGETITAELTTTNNYNLASDEKIGELSQVLAGQSAATAAAVTEQKNTTNEIVNSLQSTAKTNTIMIAAVASVGIIGGVYVFSKRRKK
jgi:TRAP-type uncharacterized transport system fused permease subunit